MPPLPMNFAALRSVSRRISSRPVVALQYRCAIPYRNLNTTNPKSSKITTPDRLDTAVPRSENTAEQQEKIGQYPAQISGDDQLQKPPQFPWKKPRAATPSYELSITCTPCGTRSTHSVSKHGYHLGSVLITCPSCRNRHVISDHLRIFGDRDLTIEDLMKEQGQIFKKGTLSEDGNMEFWSDGTMTERAQDWSKPRHDASTRPEEEENEDEDEVSIRGESFKPTPKNE
ncbi:DNL zinc finger domain containing protein [Phlyctema vagabunda]|uniref:DNL zinc finger domain containing protein n=1 Tax=Phlyctema vagabunda TaxID=108571 RepID=A0ABR4P7Y3_9HELO